MKIIDDIIDIVQQCDDGNIDPLKAYVMFKRIEITAQNCLKQIQNEALIEANKYPEKVIGMDGAEVMKKRAAGRWDYSQCVYVTQAKEEAKRQEEIAKQAYKASQRGQQIFNEESGEVFTPASYTEGADTIYVTLK
jgi:hypothetical protein